jgi:hypothetical protein
MARGIGDRQALLRSVGGLLLAVGCVVILSRRSGAHHWTKFELTALIAVPAVLLYGLAVAGAPRAGAGGPEAWRSILLVTAVLLAPVTLFLLLDWVGANTKHLLYDAGVLVLTAALATVGARRAQAPYVVLLAGLALLLAWMLVWVKIIHDPSAETVRWLLLAGGALLLMVSSVIGVLASRALGAGELAIAGAVGAVAAGLVGIFVGGFEAVDAIVGGPLTSVTSSESSGSASSVTVESTGTATNPGHGAPVVTEHVIHRPRETHVFTSHFSGGQTLGWDIYLLVLSLGLLLAAARTKTRGLGYVGAIGLLFFIESVGTQLSRLLAGHGPSSSLAGWPLVLVVLGVAGLAASWTRPRRRADST